VKRFCEPKRRRRSWLTWFYDTSKQGVGSTIIHFANIYLATLFQGDPCTWYLVSFLLDSSVGLLVIYAGIRSTLFFAEKYKLKLLFFGEYGTILEIFILFFTNVTRLDNLDNTLITEIYNNLSILNYLLEYKICQ